jgi:hypothetical protein
VAEMILAAMSCQSEQASAKVEKFETAIYDYGGYL